MRIYLNKRMINTQLSISLIYVFLHCLTLYGPFLEFIELSECLIIVAFLELLIICLLFMADEYLIGKLLNSRSLCLII